MDLSMDRPMWDHVASLANKTRYSSRRRLLGSEQTWQVGKYKFQDELSNPGVSSLVGE